jgi:hypothetical protein
MNIFDYPIESLDLDVRTFNYLKRSGICEVGQIFDHTDSELCEILAKRTLNVDPSDYADRVVSIRNAVVALEKRIKHQASIDSSPALSTGKPESSTTPALGLESLIESLVRNCELIEIEVNPGWTMLSAIQFYMGGTKFNTCNQHVMFTEFKNHVSMDYNQHGLIDYDAPEDINLLVYFDPTVKYLDILVLILADKYGKQIRFMESGNFIATYRQGEITWLNVPEIMIARSVDYVGIN